ncbi:MAG: glycosyltransferase [Nitrospirae bacterium]|nr:glycosyltransferase [Nitrospirota bacterium]
MNIFIIPSWYPSVLNPINGIFFQEQAVAIGKMYPDANVAISLWGANEYTVSLKKPLKNFQLIRDFLFNRLAATRKLLENVYEYNTPVITWSERLHGGNRKGVLAANLQNFEKALNTFGKVDIIHAHAAYPGGWIAMHLSQATGVPFIITEHMGPFPFPSFIRNERLISKIEQPLKKARAVIAVSPALAKKIQSFGMKEPVFIPNMVNENFFSPKAAKHTEKITFFTLGSMIPSKGISDLLYAIEKVIKQNYDVAFRIGGGGECLDTYMALAKKLQIDSYIKWLGPLSRDEARREFQDCNAFILPSRHESFGVVYAEAIACGKPVIATRCGGPECIVNQNNGILVDVGAVEQIAEAIARMVKDIATYNSKIIRDDFLIKFSRQAVARQLMSIYEQCAN